MAHATVTEVMNASCDSIYEVLKDYERYPEFMEGVTTVTVLERDGANVKAEYSLNLIKKFKYILNLVEDEAAKKLTWSFESGDMFKQNSGSWELKDLGDGTTEVTYTVDLDFKVMVPGMISKKLVKTSLPGLMKSLEQRAMAH